MPAFWHPALGLVGGVGHTISLTHNIILLDKKVSQRNYCQKINLESRHFTAAINKRFQNLL